MDQPTHILVEITDRKGTTLQKNVTIVLEPVLITTQPKQPTRSLKRSVSSVAISSTSTQAIMFEPVSRGQHELCVCVNDSQIRHGSNIKIVVYPNPCQLDHPIKTLTGVYAPYGCTFNSRNEIIVSEWGGHRISVFDIKVGRILMFGRQGDSPGQMIYPKGIATDNADNIYVTSYQRLQKFTSNGQLIKCIRDWGEQRIEFDPRGVTVHSSQVYVCDSKNHVILVFDLDLNFVQSIGSRGKGNCEFDRPQDVKFDAEGCMYISELGNRRVQVMNSSGEFVRLFGQDEEQQKLARPFGVHIADNYVYVSDEGSDHISVYKKSGSFVTLFGNHGRGDGEFVGPRFISSCCDSFIYVCDFDNDRIQVF